MSINKVTWSQGIKGKRAEDAVKTVSYQAVGKIETEKVAVRKGQDKAIEEAKENGWQYSQEDDRLVITRPYLVEDGVVSDLKEALSLFGDNTQAACDGLVRHHNHLAYRTAVEAVTGVEAPDELDELVSDLDPTERATFKRTATSMSKFMNVTRLKAAEMLLAGKAA